MLNKNMKDEELQIKCKGGGSVVSQAPIFSPDGQSLFIPWKNLIRCYNVRTGEIISDFDGCENSIASARFHPSNSALLVGCTVMGEIAIWKWQTRVLISVHKIKYEIEEVISFHLVPSNNGNDCDILLCWKNRNKYRLGLFTLENLEYKASVDILFSKQVIAVGVGSLEKSAFIAAIDDKNLFCVTLDGSKKSSCKSGDKRNFTCLTCHPEKDCVATGDNTGRVIVWRGLFTNKAPAKSVYHWHTLPVNTLAFSQTGTILYSGGNECVVVKWQLDNLNKNFLPRLPAPILHLSSSDGNAYMAISTKDNAIHVTDAQFRPKSVIQHLTWAVSTSAGIQVDSRTKSLVMNGHIGNIQFYSPHTMSLLYNLDIVGQNKLTEERNTKIPNTNVSKIALSKSGEWLACIEDRISNNIYQEIRIKFFKYDGKNQSYVLNTSVEYPHEDGVNSIEFQSPCNSSSLLCATSGNDYQFKIWNLVDTSDIYRKNQSWRCWSSASYKSFPCSSLSFSSDGSLLIVAFGPCLTAWTPDTCELKCSLVHPNYRCPLKIVQCGNVDQCHLVVAASAERICVWNLLTLALMWTVPLQVAHLCADPLSTYMAVFTQEGGLFIFSPGSSSPVFSRKKVTNDNNQIVAASFVPRISENSSDVIWQRLSQLYFINTNQELLCFESSAENAENRTLEYTSEAQKTAFGALIAASSISNKKEQENVVHLGKGLSSATEIKELLEPPVHTMAPMRLLCGSVLRSLIMRENDVMDKEPSEKDIEDTSEDNGNDLDSDNETIYSQKTMKIPKKKRDKRKTKKEDLQNVLAESYEWTKIEPLGFLGEHSKLEITVQRNDKQHVLQFFVKTIPCGIKAHSDYINQTGVFKKEALLYKEIFGKLQSLIETKFSPNALFVNTDSHIILEDLSVHGYRVIEEKSSTFDLPHAKCCVETLARLHVASIIFEEIHSTENEPYRIYDHYKHMLFETTFSFEEGHPRNDWRITTMRTLVDLAKKMNKYKNKDCETSLRKLEEGMRVFIAPSTKFRNVLNHCDLWSNNIMFTYGKDSAPKHCVIVDWQMIRYAPPCYDFLQLLYLTTTRNFHEQHFQELVDIYIRVFSEELQRHNLDSNKILTKEEFLQSCEEYKPAALLESAMFGTIVYLNGDFSKDMLADDDTFNDFMLNDRSKLVCRLFDEDIIYRSRVESIIDQLLSCII